jgi:hypothetical protein
MAIPTPETQFTRDILGNYVCNSFAEAAGSGPFDVVIIGGGTFGLALAQDLLFRTQQQGRGALPEDSRWRPAGFRILVLEAGPFRCPNTPKISPISNCIRPGPCRSRG